MKDKNSLARTSPQKREYHLKCKIKFVKGTTDVKGVKIDRTMAILIPDESDQRTYFLSAWLPEVKEERFELVGYIPYPINSNLRMSIHRGPDEYCDTHYLFVMSKGVEEDFVTGKMEGKSIQLRVFGEDDEEQADIVRESEGNYDHI